MYIVRKTSYGLVMLLGFFSVLGFPSSGSLASWHPVNRQLCTIATVGWLGEIPQPVIFLAYDRNTPLLFE
jgi:hypothetical protein